MEKKTSALDKATEELIASELRWKERAAAKAREAARVADGGQPHPVQAGAPRKEGDGGTDGASARESSAPVDSRHGLCGLALSGGGIRSATFNLGLLQGLQQMGVLKYFDYLATVSGGGYIGGFWTAWRHYHDRPGALFPSGELRGSRGADLPEVRHLREFSNFLCPRLGLLSADTGRMIAAAVGAAIPALLAALALIVLVLMLWAWFAEALLFHAGNPHEAPGLLTVSGTVMLLLTFPGLVLCEVFTLKEDARARRLRHLEGGLPSGWGGRLGLYVAASLAATGGVLFFWDMLVARSGGRPGQCGDAGLCTLSLAPPASIASVFFTPSLAWVATVGVIVLLRWLLSRFLVEQGPQGLLATMERVTSRLLLLAALWAVVAAFWVAGRSLVPDSSVLGDVTSSKGVTAFVGVVTALTAMFARAQQLFSRQASRPTTPGAMEKVKSLIPPLLAYVTLSLLVVGMVLLLFVAKEGGWLRFLLQGALGVTVLTLIFFDPNRLGLHAFYRSRIARAFVGAAHDQGPGQTEPHPEDVVWLDSLKQGDGPIHLICCAANDLSSEDPMANLYRGAESAVLSPVGFCVGSFGKLKCSPWGEVKKDNHLSPTLAAAMTASGAAFNSHMGSMSMKLGPAVTFLMTAFNLRLGLWWPHPTSPPKDRLGKAIHGLEQAVHWLCRGLPFYKELLGWSRASGRNVLLSDGGHFENLALYELVRRRCRYIVLSDCGMDTEAEFNDFANAVRRVREDFGVEIRIDLSPLRPDPSTGLARQPMVAGDIEYPEGNTGVLLMLKPTLVGDEPADIAQYKARNAAFPHETTGDQFYDEAQWESYRRLGEHAAFSAFRNVMLHTRAQLDEHQGQEPARETELDQKAREARARRELELRAGLFASARHEWLPMPAGYEERFSRLVSRASELDLLLQRPDNQRLFREVFKEIPELDSQAKQQRGRRGGRGRWERFGLALSGAGRGNGRSLKNAPLSSQDLSTSLQMIRRALLFMEEVFISENLDARYNHPAYLGIINYFARWAYAPLFRMWWPLLKTFYPLRFTRFLEQHFSLPSMANRDIGQLSEDPHGFARDCWDLQRGRTPAPGLERILSYQLDMPYGGEAPCFHIQAAQVLVREPLTFQQSKAAKLKVLAWNAEDFYVPPGLWGSGVGEDFLRLLTANCTQFKALDEVELLAVEILVDRDAPPPERKRGADEMQLYRSRGFSEPELVHPELSEWLEEQGIGDGMAVQRKQGKTVKVHRLVRYVGPPEPDSAHQDRSPARSPAVRDSLGSEDLGTH
jgi:hypothetical protein